MDQTIDSHEVILALEGERQPRQISFPVGATAKDVLIAIVKETKRTELTEIFLEDGEECLVEEHRTVEIVRDEFKLIHVASKGKIAVSVLYNGRKAHRDFAPSVTVQTIIAWAISPKGLGLEGSPAEYQLKMGKELLPPDLHLGQVVKGEKRVDFSLVFRVKPQGAS